MTIREQFKFKVLTDPGLEPDEIYINVWRVLRKLGCDSFYDGENFSFTTRRIAKRFTQELGFDFKIEPVN